MKTSTLTFMLAGAFVVAGCNDSGGSSSSSNDNGDGDNGSSETTEIGGILIAPESQVQSNSRLLNGGTIAGRNETSCAGIVPSGYDRIADTEVNFLDDADTDLGSANTDSCGIFNSADIPSATRMRAEPEGRRPIETDVDMFRRSSGDSDNDRTVVSTIDNDANYEIRSLFRQSDGRLGFTVRDDKSGRPVIGLPDQAFTLTLQGQEIPLARITSGAQSGTREAASVTLVLDASGSMRSNRVYDDEAGNTFSRFHVARDASHLFLGEKGSQDEVSVLIFGGSNVDLINDEFLDQHIDIRDASGNETSLTFSDSGFTTDVEPLRFVIDMFEPYNNIYSNPYTNVTSDYNRDPHPDTPELTIAGSYRWFYGTPLFESVYDALDATDTRSNSRKAVVTMGDGASTFSDSKSLVEATGHANDLGIPVYAVGLGLEPSDDGYEDLESLGTDTGGDFVNVEDSDAETELLNTFENIQIGLVYQYLATLADQNDIQENDVIKLELDYNGITAESNEYTVPATGSGS